MLNFTLILVSIVVFKGLERFQDLGFTGLGVLHSQFLSQLLSLRLLALPFAKGLVFFPKS